MSDFMPISYSFNYCDSIIHFEIRRKKKGKELKCFMLYDIRYIQMYVLQTELAVNSDILFVREP